ncbi:hypothetical protein BU14_0116s0048 [Porphyra umbilicalis]|uniref:Uncharacterized protein n=1 Tax=Porphyra umbilicalis TaxID=2786 RepID=A0A1X6PBI3_PORUM|nr:hypothetical protein BU14_0116s0048 [Porphyra umbilicalis]|eukprot:OSX78228.1 hypothetical protein BU14_0116s0048 [Porphyra umbilicalis]
MGLQEAARRRTDKPRVEGVWEASAGSTAGCLSCLGHGSPPLSPPRHFNIKMVAATRLLCLTAAAAVVLATPATVGTALPASNTCPCTPCFN